MQRVEYLKKFVSLFILTGVAFTSLVLFVLFSELKVYQYKSNKDKANYEVNLKKEKIKEFYEHYKGFLITIENNRFFTSFLKSNTLENKENLITLFETLAAHENYVTQLRYLDESGKEIVRVDRKKIGESIVLIDDKYLQNKKHRDYFFETMKKNKRELFVSKLDLNIEHKKIEIPYKPVWRFAMPVFEDSKRRGIIILNVFAASLLGDLEKSNSFEIDIFDQDNHILVSSKKNEWTRYLNLEKEIDKKEFIYNDVLIDGINDETLYIGMIPKDSINSFIKLINLEIVVLILVVILVSFLLAKVLASIPKKLFDELEKQQKMLISQSKIAAMGEMTAMLAHQWRQPLNAISVLIQELEIKYSMKLITKEEFARISRSITQKLEYMSKTIDGFRDFYKTKEKAESFNLVETIEKSFNIIQMKLEKSAIKKEITLLSGKKEDYILFANENEIEQVFINIINNAIDAIDENCEGSDKRFINVSLALEDKKIEINFQDSGKGISNKVLDNLFEPYSSTKLEKNGTGLGLYMAKTIIEKNMKGKIFVENKEFGASFTIILNR